MQLGAKQNVYFRWKKSNGEIQPYLSARVKSYVETKQRSQGLFIILVGEDSGSKVYVKQKQK
ncbi:hypothetical protein DRO61_05115 [Candidatus Bathyarchaeota archaeon]|nr:MAG: hypothetical protein DRO61_05115 [Candidatus Bathyarchaeota archaeon]